MWLARWSYRLIHVKARLFYKANCLAQIAQMLAILAHLEFMRGILEEGDYMSRAYNPHFLHTISIAKEGFQLFCV